MYLNNFQCISAGDTGNYFQSGHSVNVSHYNFKQSTMCSGTSAIHARFTGSMLTLVSSNVWQMILFSNLTIPAGPMECIQSFAETPCIITLAQIHPFTAGIGRLMTDNEHGMDTSAFLWKGWPLCSRANRCESLSLVERRY